MLGVFFTFPLWDSKECWMGKASRMNIDMKLNKMLAVDKEQRYVLSSNGKREKQQRTKAFNVSNVPFVSSRESFNSVIGRITQINK